MTMPEYLTTEEVARIFRTSAETIRYWRQTGNGPISYKFGKRVLYNRDDLDQFIAQSRSTALRSTVTRSPAINSRTVVSSGDPPKTKATTKTKATKTMATKTMATNQEEGDQDHGDQDQGDHHEQGDRNETY